MVVSRRTALWRIGSGAAISAAMPSLARAWDGDAAGEAAGGPEGAVRLHRNENAAGPSPSVDAAIRQASSNVRRYPEQGEEALRSKLAEAHRVSPENIVLGCGSSELLRMASESFAGPRNTVVMAAPTFDLMGEAVVRAGADVLAVRLTSNHTHDLDAMLARIDGDTTLVYVCNPNNPTGTLTRRKDLELFISRLPTRVRVIVDEAYHHYVAASSEYASFIDQPIGDDRVIVTRTFSAIHGLAGLRIGYAVADRAVARRLSLRRLSNGVNAVAAAAASAAMDDVEYVRSSAMRNADDRQEFSNQANARMLRVIDSHANFVMLNVERHAVDVAEHFRKHDVLVAGPFPHYPTYVRVSLGAPDEMTAFWRAWDLLPVQHMSM